MLRRPIGLIGVIILLIIAGFIILNIPWGGSKEEAAVVQEKQLVDYADTDTKVRLIQNGTIVANQDHHEVWITAGRDEVRFEIIKGYERNVVKSRVFNNSEAAFKTFLAALANLNFNKARDYRGIETELGSCPAGQRLLFDTFTAKENLQHTWATTCSNKVGTFGGDSGEVRALFRDQVPNYNDLISGVRL